MEGDVRTMQEQLSNADVERTRKHLPRVRNNDVFFSSELARIFHQYTQKLAFDACIKAYSLLCPRVH